MIFKNNMILFSCLLAACTTVENIPETEHTITPMEFYQSFNMRTIYSSLGPRLRYYCESFPHQFFNIVKKSDNYLELAIEGHSQWFITFSSGNSITLTDNAHGATYLTSTQYDLAITESHDEWHAIAGKTVYPGSPEADELEPMGEFIRIASDCNLYQKND
ncbi:hypothetical protein [Hwanghaeella sp. LZ110]|uniref:hypothetical protein n=1 Tax=Hwanghaeella sp. LZ110 TaxID=3402810 RepID=UPI003B66B41E